MEMITGINEDPAGPSAPQKCVVMSTWSEDLTSEHPQTASAKTTVGITVQAWEQEDTEIPQGAARAQPVRGGGIQFDSLIQMPN